MAKCKQGMQKQNGKCVWKNSTWMDTPQCRTGLTALGLFIVALAILFITLKLLEITAVATLSWFWVLSPVIIPLGIVFIILGFVLGFKLLGK